MNLINKYTFISTLPNLRLFDFTVYDTSADLAEIRKDHGPVHVSRQVHGDQVELSIWLQLLQIGHHEPAH